MSSRIAAIAAGILLLSSTSPDADTSSAKPTRTETGVLSAELERWFSSPALRQAHTRRLRSQQTTRVDVTIRLFADDPAVLESLEGPDLQLTRHEGAPLRLGTVFCAQVSQQGLARLADHPSVARVELASVPFFAPDLEVTTSLIGATDAWSRTRDGTHLTGVGTTIAVMDDGIDVFHPSFFRADGGYFDWLDVDGDGSFTPGIDAVDLDTDGHAGEAETIRYINAIGQSLAAGDMPILDTESPTFELGWDHLYADSNGNGARDFGPAAGFTESSPGYGEPMFVADDVDRNGVLDIGERLVMLGTSKIRAMRTSSRTLRRGVDLIRAVGHRSESATHGTNVAGIVVAGWPGRSIVSGVAPDAELLVSVHHDIDGYGPALAWAVQEGADAVVNSNSSRIWVHLDGSTNYEAMADAAVAGGTVVVNSAGNLGNRKVYTKQTVAAGGSVVVPVEMPDDESRRWLALSVHWRSPGRDLQVGLELPDGTRVDLGSGGVDTVVQDMQITSLRDDSARGTARFDVGVSSLEPLPSGVWQFTIDAPSGATEEDLIAHLYAWDDSSPRNRSSFGDHASTEHLVSFPATADRTLSATSFAGRDGPEFEWEGAEKAGFFRSYSSRGRRIDGQAIVDVAAPDNPLTPTNARVTASDAPLPLGSYDAFSGTSAAAPHVAGVAALVRQAWPEMTASEIGDRIRNNARVDELVTGDEVHAVEELWGHGKLDAYGAIFESSPAPNEPPVVSSRQAFGRAGKPLVLPLDVRDSDDPASNLEVRVDAGYDGAWDGPPLTADVPVEVMLDAPGLHYVKVEVRDPAGASSAALVPVLIEDKPGGCGCSGNGSGEGVAPLLLLFIVAFTRLRRAPS